MWFLDQINFIHSFIQDFHMDKNVQFDVNSTSKPGDTITDAVEVLPAVKNVDNLIAELIDKV